MNKIEIEKALKRQLKKSVGYSLTILIGFLINGQLTFGVDSLENSKKVDSSYIKKIQEELEEKILEINKELSIVENSENKSVHFLFSPSLERRRAKRSHDNGISKLEINSTIEIPDIRDNPKPDIPIIKNPLPNEDNILKEPQFIFNEVGEVNIQDIPKNINITIDNPKLPITSINEENFNILAKEDIVIPKLSEDIEKNLTLEKIPQNIRTDIEKPKINEIKELSNFTLPQVYVAIKNIIVPESFSIKDVKINTTGITQNSTASEIVRTANQDVNAIVQNYSSYESVDDSTNIRFSLNDIGYGIGNDSEGNPNYAEGSINSSNGVWQGDWGKNVIYLDNKLNGTIQWNNQGNALRKYFWNSNIGTFINDAIEKNTEISGVFNVDYTVMGKKGSTSVNDFVRMFLNVSSYGLNSGDSEQVKVTKVKGKNGKTGEINLTTGEREDTIFNGNLIAINHQIYDKNTNSKSYSVLLNEDDINLGNINEDGSGQPFSKNMIGIMVSLNQSQEKDKNHKTINNGNININGTNSIGFSFEETKADGDLVLRDDAYIGNIKVAGLQNYGFRMANIYQNGKTYFDKVKIFGNTVDGTINYKTGENVTNYTSKINVVGKQNIGMVVGKSLSDGVVTYSGADKAKVNPIDNFENISIEVDGDQTIGFVRDKNYSDNNKNDMIINSKNINNITFGKNAKNSVLFRSEMYGITNNNNLNVSEAGENNLENDYYNIVMQATRQSWDKGENTITYVNSSGSVTNIGEIFGNTNNMIGMMASGEIDINSNTWQNNDNINNSKALATNKGNISFAGINNIGMAILNDNTGNNSGTITVEGNDSIGVYNTGTFVNTGTISIAGKDAIAIYNKQEIDKINRSTSKATLNLEGTIINISDNSMNENSKGATAIYSEGGTINLGSQDKITKIIGGKNVTAGIYTKTDTKLTGNINISGTNTGIVSDSGVLNITGGNLTYSGNGFALFTKDGENGKKGKINLDSNSMLTLSGKAYGINIDINKTDTDKAIDFNGAKININSNDVIVFNIDGKGNYTINSGDGSFPGADSLKNYVGSIGGIEENDYKGYKIASIEAGTINLNSSNGNNENLLKKYDFQRSKVNMTTDTNLSLENDEINTYFGGDIIGIGISSSVNKDETLKTKLEDTQININNGSTLIANRKEQATILSEQNSNTRSTVGAYIDYGIVNLTNGKIIVENSDASNGDIINDNGVGIFSKNGSKVTLDKDSVITVYGNHGIGIYGEATKEIQNKFGGDITQVDIENSGTINIASGKSGVGIYIDAGTEVKGNIRNIGNIEVAEGTVENPSVGIYGVNTNIINSGNIVIGKNIDPTTSGVGIYADNSLVTSGGTITLGSNVTGIRLNETSNLSSTGNQNLKFLSLNGDTTNRIGIYAKGGENSQDVNINFNIDMESVVGGNAVVVDSRNIILKENNEIKISGNNGRGIRVLSSGVVTNNGTLTIAKENTQNNKTPSSIGIIAEDTNGTIVNNGVIEINSTNGIGIYVNNTSEDEKKSGNTVTSIGTIKLNGNKNIGVAIKNNDIQIGNLDTIEFAPNINESVGIYATDNSIITNNKELSISGNNIGIYLGKSSKYTGNGNIKVSDGAIGIYLDIGANSLENIKIDTHSNGERAIGVVLEGNAKEDKVISGAITLNGGTQNPIQGKTIGIYSNNSNIIVKDSLTITNSGSNDTGMYVKNSTLSGNGTIKIEGTGEEINGKTPNSVGIYYISSNVQTPIISENNLKVQIDKSNTVGVYLAEGNTLKKGKTGDVMLGKDSSVSNVTGIVVGENSTFDNKVGITLYQTSQSIGIASLSGNIINKGTISLNTISNNTGIYLSGKSNLNNTGTIKIAGTADENNLGIGIYTKGEEVTIDSVGNFDMTKGNVAIYSDGTDFNSNINLNSKNLNGQDTNIETIALVVKSDRDSTIEGITKGTLVGGTSDKKMKITLSKGATGIYAEDSGVKMANISIDATTNEGKVGELLSYGVYLEAGKNDIKEEYEVDNIDISLVKGIGIIVNTSDKNINTSLRLQDSVLNINSYSEGDAAETGIGIYTNSGKITLNGGNIINTTFGIGVIAGENSITNIGNGEKKDILNIKGYSVGVYSKKGDIELGTNTDIKFQNGKAEGEAVEVSKGVGVYTIDGKITSSANITTTEGIISENVVGLFGKQNINEVLITNKQDGNIQLNGSSVIGIAGLGNENSVEKVTVTNEGIIVISGKTEHLSAAIYGEKINIINNGEIIAKDFAIGIYSQGTDKNNIISKIITLVGKDGIGVVLKGTTEKVDIDGIKGISDRNLGLYLDEYNSSNNNIGTINLGNQSMGIYINNSNVTFNKVGDIIVGNDGIGIASIGNSTDKTNINSILNNGKIKVGDNGTAIYVQNSKLNIESLEGVSAGKDGVIAHINNGTLQINSIINELTLDGNIGIVLENNGNLISKEGEVNKLNIINGGTGIVIKGNNTKQPSVLANDMTISLGSGVLNNKDNQEVEEYDYSLGIYYQDNGKILNNNKNLNITYKENTHHAIGSVYSNTYGVIDNLNITMNNSISDSIGVIVKENGLANNIILSSGTEDELININGYHNIGIIGKNSVLETNGKIKVGLDEKSSESIGIYLSGTNSNSKYTYKGIGDIEVGSNSIGIYSKNYNVIYSGTISSMGKGSIGIVNIPENTSKNFDTLNINDSILNVKNEAIGILGKDSNIVFDNSVLEVKNENSQGIVNLYNGDISFNGSANISGKGSSGVYKNTVLGNEIDHGLNNMINIGKGEWYINNIATGIVAISREKDETNKIINIGKSITINNDSNMTLTGGAIGIYSVGNNILNNNGNINVGESIISEENLASIGIYMSNDIEETIATGVNTGNIIVEKNGGVGIQAAGYVNFTNKGEINVANGAEGLRSSYGAKIINTAKINIVGKGIGMIASGKVMNGQSSIAINEGIINLEKSEDLYESTQENIKYNSSLVGMAAVNGGHIINGEKGIINVNDGIGMYVDKESKITNTGVINVNNGIGIMGVGKLDNTGKIIVNSGNLNSKDIIEVDENQINKGSLIVNREAGILEVNKNFSNIGGSLETDYSIKLNNPTVDITVGGAGFIAPEVSGEIKLNSNFALKGNGFSYEVEDFIDGDSNIGINTSPLFETELKEGNLVINKVNYKDITLGDQYDNRDNSLDNILLNGGTDAEILKNLNYYLDSLGDTNLFNSESNRLIGAIGGNVYSNIQSRMQDIERIFDNSFAEMINSQNPTEENSKFHLIYTDGDYKNPNKNVINYDYIIRGLNYMKEYDFTSQGKKYGYTFGFTGANFSFKDSFKSEEDVYSLKGGIHRINYYNNGISWETKGNIGYNHHRIERNMSIPNMNENGKINNRAWYGSYQISLDNKVKKDLYFDEKNNFGIYTALNLEYGLFDDIKEHGDLELKIKSNDYLSSKAIVGIEGKASKAINEKWSLRINSDINYSYDFGNNYSKNEARFKSEKDYYSLSSEIKTRDVISGKVGVSLDKLDYFSVTLHGQASKDFKRNEDYWNVGLTITYRFNNYGIPDKFLDMHSYFDFNKSELTSKEKENIKEMAEYINQNNIKGTILIEGHTDDRGKVSYNDKLSLKRADVVKNEFEKNLTDKENIQIKVKAYGQRKPKYKNINENNRSKNRRTDVNILNK